MACVLFAMSCYKCKHDDLNRRQQDECPKCGSKDIYVVKEWDEAQDHYDDPGDNNPKEYYED